ncbi:MAG: hypothetical protein ACI828_001827 [Flavobacteriales bacterium]|jgi:hypothetical protein
MNAYQSHTDRELAAVLVRSEKLTYTAKLNLRREFQKRHLDVEMETLLGGIQMHEVEIKQLKHLKDLGFTYQENSTATGIEIHRLGWAVFMDVMAIILGLVLTGIGLVYVWLFYHMFFGDNEFSLTKLFQYTLLVFMGTIGFKMLSGIDRFLDYLKFSLIQDGTTIRLQKGLGKAVQVFSLDDVHIIEEDEEYILHLGTVEITRVSADNLIHTMTLEEIVRKIQDYK